jgi:hypothetical protein
MWLSGWNKDDKLREDKCGSENRFVKRKTLKIVGILKVNYCKDESKALTKVYSRRKKIWPFFFFFVNSDTGMNQKTFISS